MSARATRQSTKQGDLVYTDDPEAITRKKGRVHYTPAPTQPTRHQVPTEAKGPPNDDQDMSTEDGDFMDASEIVVQTEAGYDPELNPDSDSNSDNESTKSSNSEARELNRRRTNNESPDDIRNFTPQPDRPRLPSGEWYMPDLNNTPLSTVMEFRSHMESGRYLFQFPKLEQYTDFDLFVVDPHTGQIEMYDDDKDITYPFSVRASRKKRNNSKVIELVKEAIRDRQRKELAKQRIPGGKLHPPTDTPYTIEQLGDILGIYEECMEKQAMITLAIRELMQKNARDKWVVIGANKALSEKIQDRIDAIFVNLGKDIGLRHQLGKSTYPLPKISLRNNIIDSEISFARFGLAVQNEIGEIIKQATRQPPVQQQINTRVNQEEHNTTPTGATSDGRAKPRKVGFSDPIHDTDIYHRLSALTVDTGSPSLTGQSSRSTHENKKKGQRANLLAVDTGSTSSTERSWGTTSDRENSRRDLSTPSPNGGNTISPIEPLGRPPHAPKPKVDDRRCYLCDKIGHMSYNCTEKIWCNYCNRKGHIESNCKDKRRASSTPNPASNSPRLPPIPRSNRHVSNTNANLSMLEHNQTILTELLVKNQQKENEAGLIKDRKDRLRRIKSFDGNNKGDCITWVDQNQSVTEELSIPLR